MNNQAGFLLVATIGSSVGSLLGMGICYLIWGV
jgi:hypothetical protein